MKRIGSLGGDLVASYVKGNEFRASLAMEDLYRPVPNSLAPNNLRRRPGSLANTVQREALWEKFLADPSQWWDNRLSKRNLKYPDFVHCTTREALWLESQLNPSCVKTEIAKLRNAHAFGAYRASYRSALIPLSFGDDLGIFARVSPSGCSRFDHDAFRKFCAEGQLAEAFEMLHCWHHQGNVVSRNLMYSLLKDCIAKKDLIVGQRLHSLAMQTGYEANSFLGTHIIRMYASVGRLLEADEVFRKLPRPDIFVWVSIISAYGEHGRIEQVMELYRQTWKSCVEANDYLFVAVIKACARAEDLTSGKLVHADAIHTGLESNLFVGSALVVMYAKCGSLDSARQVFDRLSRKDLVTWSAMLAAYSQNGLGHEALRLYDSMRREEIRPDVATFVSVLKACGSVGAIREGKQVHTEIQGAGLVADLFLGSALVDMYAKCGSLRDARRVFDSLSRRDVVTWSAMLAAYSQCGVGKDALELFETMIRCGVTPDVQTFVSILKACGSIGAIQAGRQVHIQVAKRGLEGDTVVGNALVDMYAKCGNLGTARIVFDGMVTRDVISWSTMISAYVNNDLSQEALQLYYKMQRDGRTAANHVTFASVLKACGSLGAIHQGRLIHAEVLEMDLELAVAVGSTLVDMYAKCGSLKDAQEVFETLSSKDVVTWNALINCYGHHNDIGSAIKCFEQMLLDDVAPDAATFTSLLVACSHVGLVNKGQQFYKQMTEEFGIVPGLEHYTCMVDLLARSGHLQDAERLLQSTPFRDDIAPWIALLSACKSHRDIEMGRRCFTWLMRVEPQHSAGYILMADIYASAGKLKEANEIKQLMKSAGAVKKPAKAFIELKTRVHEFVVGESRDDTSLMLQSLHVRALQGHLQDVGSRLLSISEHEEQDALCGHAEKLALAFGMLNTPPGTPLLINKSLRMCGHCHNGTKIISKFDGREIIVRDAHRVHRFRDGVCSCGDHH